MFSKLCFTAALVAIASAGNDEYVNMQAANTGAAADAAGQGSYPNKPPPSRLASLMLFAMLTRID